MAGEVTQRKVAISNEEVIRKLCEAGYITKSDMVTKASEYCELWKKGHGRGYWGTPNIFSYMIPVDIYKKTIARYNVQFQKGTQVRLRKYSSRSYRRNPYTTYMGDTKNWTHLGIGSGKNYQSDIIASILKSDYGIGPLAAGSRRTYLEATIMSRLNTDILIGNNKYTSNIHKAFSQSERYKSLGIRRKTSWREYDFETEDFLIRTAITGDGIFGPKKLINGTITNIYVHFLYPTWERKRESRYEVLFETGAKGIFTNDYLTRTWDIDYDSNDKLMSNCTNVNKDFICNSCTHNGIHVWTPGCQEPCFHGILCEPVFDFTDLMDTTCGKALDYANSDDKDV